MTKDDIIRIAHEAGLHIATDVHWMPIIGLKYVEKFAAIVAAAEREACIRDCDSVDLAGADDCIAAIKARGHG